MVKHRVRAQKSVAQWKKIVTKVVDFYFDSIFIQLAVLGVAILSCVFYIAGTYSSANESEVSALIVLNRSSNSIPLNYVYKIYIFVIWS
jgi:hypothetical protein